MTKISEARERYEEKVCEEYLGIPESYCTDEFSKLISNMKAGIMAVKGSSTITKEDIEKFPKDVRETNLEKEDVEKLEELMATEMNECERSTYQHFSETGWSVRAALEKARRICHRR